MFGWLKQALYFALGFGDKIRIKNELVFKVFNTVS